MPLLAAHTLGQLLIILGVFLLLVAVWCYVTYKLIQQQAIAQMLTRGGNQPNAVASNSEGSGGLMQG